MADKEYVQPKLSWMSDENKELRDWVERHDIDEIDDFIEQMPWKMLKNLRIEQQLKQPEVAKAVGISVPQYSKIENGYFFPKRNVALMLATAFGKGSIVELAAALNDELRGKMLESQEAIRKKHSLISAETVNFNVDVGQAEMKVERHRMPLHSLVDTPKVFAQEQTVQILSDDVTLIPTPPMLVGIEDAYAITAPNHHMHPRYSEGDTVYVHPGLRPQEGDDVVITLRFADREIAFIREVWSVKEQTNNTDKDFVSYELVSWAQRDFAKMKASMEIDSINQLGDMVEEAVKVLDRNKMALLLFADGKAALTGSDSSDGQIDLAKVDVIVGTERKRAGSYGRGKYGGGAFGGAAFGTGTFGG